MPRGSCGGLYHRRTLFPNKSESSTSSSFVLSTTSTPPPKTTSSSLSSPISSSVVLAGNGTPPPIYSPLGLIEELYSNDPWKLLISTIFLNRTRRIQVDRILYKFFERYPTPKDLLIVVNEGGNSSICSEEAESNKEQYNSNIEIEILSSMIRPLGFNHRRAKGIIQFTHDYVQLIKEKKKLKLLQQTEEEETRTEQQQQQHQQQQQRCNENHVIVKKEEDSTTTMQEDDSAVPPEFQFSRKDVESLYQCGTYAADAYEIFIRKNWDTNSKQQPPTDHALRAYIEWKNSLNLNKTTW